MKKACIFTLGLILLGAFAVSTFGMVGKVEAATEKIIRLVTPPTAPVTPPFSTPTPPTRCNFVCTKKPCYFPDIVCPPIEIDPIVIKR